MRSYDVCMSLFYSFVYIFHSILYLFVKKKKKYHLFNQLFWEDEVALRRAVGLFCSCEQIIYDFCVFLGNRTAWMFGKTPPWAIVTPDRSLFSSSSLRIANCK